MTWVLFDKELADIGEDDGTIFKANIFCNKQNPDIMVAKPPFYFYPEAGGDLYGIGISRATGIRRVFLDNTKDRHSPEEDILSLAEYASIVFPRIYEEVMGGIIFEGDGSDEAESKFRGSLDDVQFDIQDGTIKAIDKYFYFNRGANSGIREEVKRLLLPLRRQLLLTPGSLDNPKRP